MRKPRKSAADTMLAVARSDQTIRIQWRDQGSTGSDDLTGFFGADTLNGYGGADHMAGGLGDDFH